MKVLLRAVISGFGFSLGAALFKRASRAVGFEEGAGNGDSSKRGDRTEGDGEEANEDEANEDEDRLESV